MRTLQLISLEMLHSHQQGDMWVTLVYYQMYSLTTKQNEWSWKIVVFIFTECTIVYYA